MEIISITLVIIGGGIVWYFKRYAKEAVMKEANREASHIKNLVEVDYELERLDSVWKRDGVLSDQERAFMEALHSRRFDLQRHAPH